MRTILHVTNIPTPYRLPQYREFSRALGAHRLRLMVYFIGFSGRKRRWEIPEFEFDGFDSLHASGSRLAVVRALGITRTIDHIRPAVVVLAWAMDATALLVLLHCRHNHIPCLLYTGETAYTAKHRSFPHLRAAFRRQFFKRVDGAIAYGSNAKEYVERNGVAPERVSIAINVVDAEFFERRVRISRESGEPGALRSRFLTSAGGPFALHLLCVGDLIPLKRIPLLIEALARLHRDDVALHIVGSGSEEQSVRKLVSERAVDLQVFFHGFKQKEDLPLWYAMADALVFPSTGDVFGLVMVEAAAAGLPVIASPFSGGTADVVRDGVNGFIIDPHDIEAMARAFERLANDPELRRKMGAASAAHARSSLTLARSAAGYLGAVQSLLEK